MKSIFRSSYAATKAKKQNKSLFNDLHNLLSHISKQRRQQLGLLLILMVISAFSEMLSLGAVLPFLNALNNSDQLLKTQQLQPLVNLLKIDKPSQLLMFFAILFAVAVVIANGLRILTINIQSRLAGNISNDISCLLYNRTLLQPYVFHLQHNSSDLINSVMEDTRQLTSRILIPLLIFVTNSLLILALVGGLFLIDWRAALTSAVVLGSAYARLYQIRRKRLQLNSNVLVQSSQQQVKVVQEGLGGIRNVLIGGTQSFFQSAYKKADQPYRQALASNMVIQLTPRYQIEMLAMVVIAILAVWLSRVGNISQTLSVLGALAVGANRLLPLLQQEFVALTFIQGARASLKRILRGLNRPIDPLQLWVPTVGLGVEDELRFENIWFRYSDESSWIFKNLNLRIAAKTTVGFVGSSGSGKSTTADLILGLLSPQKGCISVDGVPLEGERLRQWQQSIAHVPQSIFLMDGTIAENIAFGIPKQEIDFERIIKAARLAQIDEFVNGLPNQYNTNVGERGVRLSGGQRQRIGIARALYNNTSVLIFDEATSALDNQTEEEVMNAIESLSNRFTIILIAHRLSTLRKCDCIFEFSQGQVVAHADFIKLGFKPSTFNEVSSVN
ncbi:ABC transporter ATP-binding protein [Acaryochloris sp. CCMEE 5410]|uniref:ABC transporter ATP-binding protein n=1 Tax=Acaryochloris sp. CCMEE 5410 TaxID=310037 RepID=UPI0002484E53|nr:ABC transporter ATP-binding protein [Acaryochloris sp. CCMEE 5410]KAI9130467.1 ABC transporter ATP-binding protein [Acaryochloris sp. CCMEE 5410]